MQLIAIQREKSEGQWGKIVPRIDSGFDVTKNKERCPELEAEIPERMVPIPVLIECRGRERSGSKQLAQRPENSPSLYLATAAAMNSILSGKTAYRSAFKPYAAFKCKIKPHREDPTTKGGRGESQRRGDRLDKWKSDLDITEFVPGFFGALHAQLGTAMNWTDMKEHLFNNSQDCDTFLVTLNPAALVFTNYGSDPRAYGGIKNDAGDAAGENQDGLEYFGLPAVTLAPLWEGTRKFRPI
ncbi:hypothetical protein B0H19DRAFT_1067713 [Mycena capillaripes]|nr:hypothetical protein B0H19DRAFT_1067713 [Mycena capillaripes]